MTLYRGTGFRVQAEERIGIGEVAATAGVSVQAIRYYERRGLLPRPARRPSAQTLGFGLGQMPDFLGIAKTHLGGRRARVRALIRLKLSELDADLQELTAMRKALVAIAACRCDGDCPILEKALGAPATATVPSRSRRRQ